MFVYIFRDQDWELAGELEEIVNPSSSQHTDFHFSYTLEYGKRGINQETNSALSSLFPVRLMEVFRSPLIQQWLTQFYPLNAENIDPSHTLGNVIVTSKLLIKALEIQIDSIPIRQLLEQSSGINVTSFDELDIGYSAGSPYWLVATDGEQAFPTRAIEINPELIPVMVPISRENHFGHSIHLNFNEEGRKQYLSILYAINRLNASVYRCTTLPETSTDFALPRYDLIKTKYGYKYLSVEQLKIVFDRAYRVSSTLLELIKNIVSTYKHIFRDTNMTYVFITEFLKRDLVLRLFGSSFSITDIDIIKSDQGYEISPLSMQLFNGLKSETSHLNKRIDWPYPLLANNQMDYPLLCEALSEHIDPHDVLLTMIEFAEALVTIPKPTILADRMASFDQKLARWGLLV